MEIKTETMLDYITEDGCSVKEQQYIIIDEVKQFIKQPHRKSYTNSTTGREQLEQEYPQFYTLVTNSIWGNKPTVNELKAL